MAGFSHEWTPGDELTKLPRWAVVAFGVRCAQRVLPLYTGKGTDSKSREKLEQAIQDLAASARSGNLVDGARLGRDRVDSVVKTISHSPGMLSNSAATFAIRAVSSAFDAATYAARGQVGLLAAEANRAAQYAMDASGANPTDHDASASQYVRSAALASARAAALACQRAVRLDYELLRDWAGREGWTADTPVDTEAVGPLWWGKEPDWWPEEQLAVSDNPPVLQLEFTIPADVPKEEADRLIGEILQRANELHHSMGGTGLTITDADVYETEPSMVPVGGDDDGEGQ